MLLVERYVIDVMPAIDAPIVEKALCCSYSKALSVSAVDDIVNLWLITFYSLTKRDYEHTRLTRTVQH